MAAKTSSHGPSEGYIVVSKSSNTVSADADTFLSARKSLKGSIAHLTAAFKALTAPLKSDPTLNITKESKAILNVLDCAITMRKRLQETSPPSEKEMSKMKEEMATLEANVAALKATELLMATPMTTTPANANSDTRNAYEEWTSSIEAHNAKARAENAHVTCMDEMLEPLLDKNKEEAPEFPVDGTQLRGLTNPQLSALLEAYDLTDQFEYSKRKERFCHYIGAVKLARRFKKIPLHGDK